MANGITASFSFYGLESAIVEEATNVAGMGAALASDSAAIGMLSMAGACESLTPTRGSDRGILC